MSAVFGETLWFNQEGAAAVPLVVFGDEFYALYETVDGYTVVYDADLGRYCFALLAGGAFVSSGVPTVKRPPKGLVRHLREDPRARLNKFGNRYRRLRPRDDAGGTVMRTYGRANGLLDGRRMSEGSIRGLTILVDFSDETASVTSDDVDLLLNGTEPYRSNCCSVREYFRKLSCGKLRYSNVVVGPVRLSHPRDFYKGTLLVREALRAAVDQYGINLSQFDARGEGIVDAINIMYAGRTVYEGELWPHNSVFTLHMQGMRTHFYMLTSMGRQPVDLTIGTFCHENGHMLCRFPDLYDYGTRDGDTKASEGMGRYCLMGSGNHLDLGRTPSPVCAYLRHLVGWYEREVDLRMASRITIEHGDYATLYRYPTDVPNESFLLENRSRLDLDRYLPSSGLAVYHCDTLGSNEWQAGSERKHYQCALLQADGHLDLENDRNSGDESDLFGQVEGVALGHDTTPSSRRWDGSDSGLIIRDLSGPGRAMDLALGEPKEGKVVAGEVRCDLLIPDNEPGGVSSPIVLAGRGKAEAIKVSLGIQHTRIADLQIALEAPSGARVVLRDREALSGGRLDATYETGFEKLLGEAVAGAWNLVVSDLVGDDVGRIDHWSIEMRAALDGMRVSVHADPNLAIPDGSAAGVVSAITVDREGVIEDIQVHFEIEHTFIGDLQVELVAPSGRTLMLHDREGGGGRDMLASFDVTDWGMVGEGVKGAWELRVRDLEACDEGVLRWWGLEMVCVD